MTAMKIQGGTSESTLPSLQDRSQKTKCPHLAGAPGDLPVVPALGPDVPLHSPEDDPAVIEHVLPSLLL